MIKIEFDIKSGLSVESNTNTKEVLAFVMHLVSEAKDDPSGLIGSTMSAYELFAAIANSFGDVVPDNDITNHARKLLIERINSEEKGDEPSKTVKKEDVKNDETDSSVNSYH